MGHSLPEDLDPESAGPLLCGGITVFDPLLKHKIQATHHVGVIGIGGLGHIAIKLLKAWGCEITAFSSNPDKTEELKAMGADHVVNSRDTEAVKAQKGKFDLLLSTVNVTLNWRAFISTLAPNGSLHFLGLTLEPVPVSVGSLIDGAKSVTGSPTGSPAALRQLLKFAARKKLRLKLSYFQCHSSMKQLNVYTQVKHATALCLKQTLQNKTNSLFASVVATSLPSS